MGQVLLPLKTVPPKSGHCRSGMFDFLEGYITDVGTVRFRVNPEDVTFSLKATNQITVT